ncbi:hypothetical protein GGI07_001840 [Coemansia sp. Benny D115]|nr:hypothetical protein GGI07_001840 [Coemansia sp. Benny D115]
MKLTTAFVTIAALATIGANGQACSRNAVRKEIRSHTSAEWSRVTRVVQLLQDSGWFAWFAYVHTSNFNVIHNCELFLPFHRRFLRDFEAAGQQYDSAFAIPYWDELRDYANPSASAVLTNAYLGGNGRSGTKCVNSGNQNGWTMTFPSNHCLQREYNGGSRINAWYSPEYMQSILSRSTKMSQLRPAFEYSLHGAVHLALGGDMVMDWSPNDFAFWVHHANIDRLWFVWQMQNPAQNFWSIEGVDTANKPLNYGSKLPFYGDAIIDTMQPGYGSMCFFYDNGNTVSRKRSLDKRDERKCIPRPATQTPPLVEGVFEDVNKLPVSSDSYVKDTIVASLPEKVINKWFPTYNNVPGYSNTTDSVIPPRPDINAPVGTAPTSSEAEIYSSASATDVDSDSASDDYSDVDDSIGESESAGANNGGYSVVAIPTDGDFDNGNTGEEASLYSEDYKMFDTDENPDYGLDGVGPKYPMPNPFPLTPAWVKMHNMSPEEIHQHYQQARDFVADMNLSGYQSPFAKIVQEGNQTTQDTQDNQDAQSSQDSVSA